MDPSILAIFGQPPPSVNLSASTTAYCNSVVIALSVLAVLAVAGRVWVRQIKQAFGLDDMIGLFALALQLATMVLTILGGQYGSGKHVWSLQMVELKMIFKVLYCYTFIYGAAAAATKLSFVFSFARIFDTGIPVKYAGLKNYTRIAVWAGGFLACAYPFMVWGVMLGVCTPISHFWNQYTEPEHGSCIDTTLFFLVAGIINMFIDIIILLISIPCVLRMNLRLRQRVLLICIFMLGGFVCVASVMRIHYLQVLRNSTDVTYSTGNVFIWSSVEPAIGIVSLC
ncbi:hypothetical protein E4T52_16625 [Aureobasidium sp. EXF-3400]|nr:hypothetical protein E4T52_16625 [Aureobasidium sp. EXF-3400]